MTGYSKKQYDSCKDEELILLFRQGQPEIEDYLLEKYKPMVRMRANAYFLIGGDTEDLIQEGMIGLFKAIRDFNPDKNSSFATFARLCVSRQIFTAMEATKEKKYQPLNTALSFSAQVNPEGELLEDVLTRDWESPEQMILEQEKIREFMDSLKKTLSKMELEVLNRYLQGYNYIQIAAEMGKTPKSIDNALQRIRGKVRSIME